MICRITKILLITLHVDLHGNVLIRRLEKVKRGLRMVQSIKVLEYRRTGKVSARYAVRPPEGV